MMPIPVLVIPLAPRTSVTAPWAFASDIPVARMLRMKMKYILVQYALKDCGETLGEGKEHCAFPSVNIWVEGHIGVHVQRKDK